MNRRNFLKKLGAVCGAVVACPGELLKVTQPTTKSFWMRGRDGAYIEGELHNFKVFSTETARLKYRHNRMIKEYQGQYY